jgi:hypothetical protein
MQRLSYWNNQSRKIQDLLKKEKGKNKLLKRVLSGQSKNFSEKEQELMEIRSQFDGATEQIGQLKAKIK